MSTTILQLTAMPVEHSASLSLFHYVVDSALEKAEPDVELDLDAVVSFQTSLKTVKEISNG